ncbi:tRNA1(Val) (adenine(37)-N6)-methyltransferase [Anaerovorax odorimutans]|uniref:tRNA1(Val) (Adenine(37)-N6)-methyltransferase n=1 Tax=Anaerovorax odorimutans TaxID=109327 RepID=A0ABT1RRZ8_9FIRM|nr:tRNA1(Val) (adenine(37)-N6)-methyltransferase [Anaerovorax odorimutans]MCQ4637987.1 tRNA1(Val) (adenine(37)-N6)-methyltransferase [Anaerovorax odorimutans]
MLYKGERIDEIGFSDLRLIQKPEDFCYGVDAVILADFAARKPARRIVDLGTGTGIIPHILSHKTSAETIYGIEYQEDAWARAVRNAELNGLTERLSFIQANVADFDRLTGWADAVTANPPYMAGNGGLVNANQAKTIARHETVGTLEDFIGCACRLLRDRGDFYMVHRPSRLVDIFSLCRKYGLEPKEMRLVAPRAGQIPNIVLIHCVKGGGPELRLLETLFVYKAEGVYSDEIQRIYERTDETPVK